MTRRPALFALLAALLLQVAPPAPARAATAMAGFGVPGMEPALPPGRDEPAPTLAGEPEVVVIANPAVRAAAVSAAQLHDIFLGLSTNLPDGSLVTPVLLKEGATHEHFLARYIARSDAAFRASWRSLLFSGQAVLPRAFDSETALVEFVARTPGAVGYIARTTPHERVKILPVR